MPSAGRPDSYWPKLVRQSSFAVSGTIDRASVPVTGTAMSDRLDVNSIIRAFLPNLGVGDAFISDPYIYPLSVVGRSFGDLSGPLRIKLDDLFQAHEKISTSLMQAKAVLVQTSIS